MGWGGAFLLIQQAERWFLFSTTLSFETSTLPLILQTLLSGVSQDLVVSAWVLAGSVLLAAVISPVVLLVSMPTDRGAIGHIYAKCLTRSSVFIALMLVALLTVDAGYYRFSHQHLNFVFFEYVADLWGDLAAGTPGSQAVRQTSAEIQSEEEWGYRATVFLSLEAATLLAWGLAFPRLVRRSTRRWNGPHAFAAASTGLLAVVLITSATGASPPSMLMTPRVEGDAYCILAQNAVLTAKEAARTALFHQWEWVSQIPPDVISENDAVASYQHFRGQKVVFPYRRYPIVAQQVGSVRIPFQRPLNVLVIFVEGLDRRYLNRTVGEDRPIRVTPFLDRLKRQSVYLDHFFANGVQTSRGLFSTLCSYYPRHGAAAIKTRSDRDYLCLPSVLRERGYRTEMVVGQPGAINNLQEFFSKNGIERLYDADDFPPDAQRMGLGMTDAAIFDFITERVKTAQRLGKPLFLTTLTLSTHHPFLFPKTHPEVSALQRERDQYLPALRYFDLELERFFTGLQHDGLLKNTIVFVLGDHGRHEPQGQNDVEKQIGHFMAPLFVWLDESVQTPETFRPRVVDVIASQVDIAPTILAVTDSKLDRSPFVGHDLSCLFVEACLQDNTAYLSSVYDDLIGLASKDKIWLYSFRKASFYWTDLAAQSTVDMSGKAADAHWEYWRLLSLYVASNVLLEQNRIWSWHDFPHAL